MARTATSTPSARTAQAQTRTRRAQSQARESVEDLKSDMSTFKSRLENLASAGGAEGMANVRDLFSRMQTRFDDFLSTDFADQLGVNAAMDKGREKVDDVRDRVQENPLQSVLIAAGIGAVVGFLLRR
ncbi:MAG: DUF883 domain-containing protein [Alphaproteobacteria bacterium]|nr:MAG: DUF883 domain-containing protein [Alphaproteobacteria bacterium]